ncbi:MAG: hypothetical protein ACREWG_09550 [Gammaproteobacteria bacterium]
MTAVVVDRLPAGIEADLPQLKGVRPLEGSAQLVLVPRYDAFMRYASGLAARGANFQEIAGNHSVILVSALLPASWNETQEKILFTQPILTQPGTKRIVLIVPVASLAPARGSSTCTTTDEKVAVWRCRRVHWAARFATGCIQLAGREARSAARG